MKRSPSGFTLKVGGVAARGIALLREERRVRSGLWLESRPAEKSISLPELKKSSQSMSMPLGAMAEKARTGNAPLSAASHRGRSPATAATAARAGT